uniref:Uncharacterized protein n=1 Tax=Schistosoma japonicum TaxID=6182 RepID=Q5C212_SCHJA|nr:unknown [Schistosoma japonicum]
MPKVASFSKTANLNLGYRSISSRAVAKPTIPPPIIATSKVFALVEQFLKTLGNKICSKLPDFRHHMIALRH